MYPSVISSHFKMTESKELAVVGEPEIGLLELALQSETPTALQTELLGAGVQGSRWWFSS